MTKQSSRYVATELQGELASAVRRVLADRHLPDPNGTGADGADSLWAMVSHDLGWPWAAVGAEHGGLGLELRDLCAVATECGRFVAASSVFDTAAAAWMFEQSLLAGKLASRVVAAARIGVAWTGTLAARSLGDTIVLSGSLPFVHDGAGARAVLVRARDRDRDDEMVVLLDEEALAQAVRRRAPVTDRTRDFGHIEADDVRVSAGAVLASGDRAVWVWNGGRRFRTILLIAEALGAMEAALDMAVGYAKERHQFGRPIGSFQAVKHRLATDVVAVEDSRAAARHVAGLDPGSAESDGALALARLHVSTSFVRVTGDCIQVHGGIGCTWEHPAHLFYKRAIADQLVVWPVRDVRLSLERQLSRCDRPDRATD